MNQSPPASATRTPPSPALIIAIISIPIFIGAMDLTVVSAVLPQVIFDLEIPIQTGLDEAAWIVSGYLLTYTVAMTFMGRLSDIYGRLRVYLLALLIFGLGSYLVAVADTWPTALLLRIAYNLQLGRPDPSQVALISLIGSRMIQAFGAGAMVPVGMALVGDLYPPGKRARMLGLIAAVDTAGWVVGHLYGGILVRFFNWRVIFWLNLPLCIISFALIYRLLQRVPRIKHESRMDWIGAVLISLSLSLFNIALGAGTDFSSTAQLTGEPKIPKYVAPVLIFALFVLFVFVWQQSRSKHPLIQISLFQRPNFSAANIANFMIGFSLFIAIANVPLFINTLVATTLEQGAWESGWMLSALTVPMALASIPGGWLSDRYGFRMPSIVGIIIAVIGFGLMSGWTAETSYQSMAPQLILTGIGFGLTFAPIAAAVVNTSPLAYRGTASGLVLIFRLIGMTLGVSSITTYGLQRTHDLTNAMIETGSSLDQAVRVGMEIAEMVINETFIIAGLICALALIPILRLKPHLLERDSNE
jgi:MFS family permease